MVTSPSKKKIEMIMPFLWPVIKLISNLQTFPGKKKEEFLPQNFFSENVRIVIYRSVT